MTMPSNSRTATIPSVFGATDPAPPRSAAARWAERAGWVACGLAIAFAIGAVASKPLGDDLRCYIESARAAAEGRSPYAAPLPDWSSPVVCLYYPPPMLVLFMPLVRVGMAGAAPIAVAYGALALVLGAVLLAPLQRSLRPWVGIGIALYFPLLLELNLLNLNLLVVTLALAAWSLRERPLAAGPVLAGAIGIKVIGSPLVLLYAAAGRWRLLAWTAAALIAVAAVTAPWVGWLWADWVPSAIWRAANSELPGIRPSALRGTIPYVVGALVAAAILVAAGIGARRSARSAADLHALALAAIPLFAQFVVYPNLVMTLPLFAAVARALAPRPALLALPAAAWTMIEMPLGMEEWRFGGLVAIVAIGTALFVPPALRRASTTDADA